ncbi:hypothetical protein QLX08_009360 [Tetragonisca angustula]|uniref:Uncharacterized protein n=1 Tax=Tetragonisca angustula TaxID=166442 RepID=A0AAW0ZGW5_9HYME
MHFGRIALINVNHSTDAQELMKQTVLELKFDLAVICEPYEPMDRDDWREDLTGTVAIYRNSNMSTLPLRTIKAGEGFIGER